MEEVLRNKTVLVVDDELDLREIVASELEFMGARVFQAENILKAQNILNEQEIDLVISDIRMPGGTGIDLLETIKAHDRPCPPVILITGFADITLEDAFDKGAEALISKPFKLDDLINMAARCMVPIDERFAQPLNAQKSITTTEKDDIYFGRGGAAIEITNQSGRFDVGDTIQFDLLVGEHHINGSGVCRWVKQSDNDNSRIYMGLEFICLKSESLNQFKDMFKNRKIIPYIPNIPY